MVEYMNSRYYIILYYIIRIEISMGLGFYAHQQETRSPFHQLQRLPTTTAKGIRNLVFRADAALSAASQAASQAVSRTRAAASQATMKGIYVPVDDVRKPVNKPMHIKVATSRTPVVPVREPVREQVREPVREQVREPVREQVREPVMSRMRMRIAAEAAKANVGGSNKKHLKRLVKKLVKKPIKKVVKKPLVKPAKKKVATRRISK